MVAFLELSSWCLVTVSVMWLFLTALGTGLQCVFVVFPDHTNLLFCFSALNFAEPKDAV